MGSSQVARIVSLLLLLVQLSFVNLCLGSRKLNSLYQPPPMSLTYHNGALLEGDLPVSILWYGDFSPAQKSVVSDFLVSLNPGKDQEPSVSLWWSTIQTYMKKAGKKETRAVLSHQTSDKNCSFGKILKKPHISQLALMANSKPGGLTLVLTAKDVAVEGFCMSSCGFHSSDNKLKSAFIWVGNSETQCPGQCAWPFHQPIYGPQTTPLVAPNGDVGLDGMS
ncbi:hypothetical protein CJ030_MR0G025563 [Morella rubra]|uniref:Protein EXORDIUM n=1 Tax=Morella rubra TaxID=262757 RepID=A0A6A1UHC6_9ROSI|nr:hypothetical protein CJ030_MR0G025563 [Morella rubra]